MFPISRNKTKVLRSSSIFQEAILDKEWTNRWKLQHSDTQEIGGRTTSNDLGLSSPFYSSTSMAKVAQEIYLREQLLWAFNLIRLFLFPVVRSFSFQNMVYINAHVRRDMLCDRSRKMLGTKKVCMFLSPFHIQILYGFMGDNKIIILVLKQSYV